MNRAAQQVESWLPSASDGVGYRRNETQILKCFNDVSLDDIGRQSVIKRWSVFSRYAAEMESSGDRIQMAMPALIFGRLTDQSSMAGFADSLEAPLEELRRRRQQFLDPKVDRERFLKESPLQWETALVTEADLPRWEQELARYSRAPTPAVRQ